MFILKVRNVQECSIKLIDLIRKKGVSYDSRNGKVIRLEKPLMVEYTNPKERFIFLKERDANPFFHFFESLWMLNGNNNVDFVDYFAPMKLYSDNGITLNAAYGFRWRYHFGYDQVQEIINELKNNPNSRRAVISMWDPRDLSSNKNSKDHACNTHIYFQINKESKLDMTVLNRSNDVIFGLTGANAVHFSYLQEYISCKLQKEVGSYFQITNNAHIYIDEFSQKRSSKLYNNICNFTDNYKIKVSLILNKLFGVRLNQEIFNSYFKHFKNVKNYDLLISPYDFGSSEFDLDLKEFFSKSIDYYINNLDLFKKLNFYTNYFNLIVKPVLISFIEYKTFKNKTNALLEIEKCNQLDLYKACKDWLIWRSSK